MNKNDLRYQKTEQKIKSAYIKLLSQNKSKPISVIDICQLAQCSRNTFYLHYETRDALSEQLMHDILTDLTLACLPKEMDLSKITSFNNRLYTDDVIESIMLHQEAITILFHNDTGAFVKTFCDTIYKQCLQNIKPFLNQTIPDEMKVHIRYHAQAITGFIYEWLTNSNLSTEQAKNLFYSITNNTINTINQNLLNIMNRSHQ